MWNGSIKMMHKFSALILFAITDKLLMLNMWNSVHKMDDVHA